MNRARLSGELISKFREMENAYEGIFCFTRTKVRSGNLITNQRQIGVYISKDLLGEIPIEDLVGQLLLVEGSLINAEIDSRTRTTAFVITLFERLNGEDPEINEVEISGKITGLHLTTNGANYTLRNEEDPLITRVFSYKKEFLFDNEDEVRVTGRIRSFPYHSKYSNQNFNVSGVSELSIKSLKDEENEDSKESDIQN